MLFRRKLVRGHAGPADSCGWYFHWLAGQRLERVPP
jgi:hypothetical protein